MYCSNHTFVSNSINRYEVSDNSGLVLNVNGSLDIYIQNTPSADHESNWLPAPQSGPFTMNLRLYWPKTEVLDGSWTPPPVAGVD